MESHALIKGPHMFIFRYAPGDEEALLNAARDMANDDNCDFDWYNFGGLAARVWREKE